MASSPITIALLPVSPKYILTIGALFGWLLRSPIQQEPSKSNAPSPSLFLFLFCSIRRPKRRVDGLPYTFHPFESFLQRPPHHRRYYSVGCCIDPLSNGHPRRVLRPSLKFSMGAISTPQTRGKHAARASPDGEPLRHD